MQVIELCILLLRLQMIQSLGITVHEWRRTESHSRERIKDDIMTQGGAYTERGMSRSEPAENNGDVRSQQSGSNYLDRGLKGLKSKSKTLGDQEQPTILSQTATALTRPTYPPVGRPPPTRPPVSILSQPSIGQPLMESIYEGSSTHRRIQQCLVDGNGLFGSMNGNSTAFYFFYQVEAVSGTTESKLDGGILDDIELTLIDFLIPTFFPNECGSGGTTRKLQENDGRYFGLTSKPADFVLRGFNCGRTAVQPCFIVSGAMTVFSVGKDADTVRSELRVAIYQTMVDGRLASSILEVNQLALLNDSLGLATIPPSPAQSTGLPTSVAPNPTQAPTTPMPSVAPSTRIPTTVSPTFGSRMPTLTPAIPPEYSSAPSSVAPVDELLRTEAPTSAGGPPRTEAPSESSESVAKTTVASTIDPRGSIPQQFSPLPTNNDSGTVLPRYYKKHSDRNAFQKVPIWGWVILAVSILAFCTYTDPDDDDKHNDTARRTAMNNQATNSQDQHAGRTDDHDYDGKEAFHDEDFNDRNVEYVRKLYRQ